MVKKLSVLILVSLVLVGCNSKSYTEAVQTSLAQPLPKASTHHKQMYRYYVPPAVGIKTTNQNSTIFLIEGHDVLMNLSISDIVSKQYYEDENLADQSALDVEFNYRGSYFDAHQVSQSFDMNIHRLSNGELAIFLDNRLISMIAVIPEVSAPLVIETMITIMKSVDVNTEQVIATYSTKEIIEKDATFSEFFEQVPPETGTLQDMYEQMDPERNLNP